MNYEILLIPEKSDLERDKVALEWECCGGKVFRIDKFWKKPDLPIDAKLSIYGNDTFVLVLAQVLGLKLELVDDGLISEVSPVFVKRNIEIKLLNAIDSIEYPQFIKPVKPKTFKAAVYSSLELMKKETEGIDENEQILISEVISIEKEVRSFILQNKIIDLGYYEGEGELDDAREFIELFLRTDIDLPVTYVLDIGFNNSDGWFIIEFNATWGAGLNNCCAGKVLPCIQQATNQNY